MPVRSVYHLLQGLCTSTSAGSENGGPRPDVGGFWGVSLTVHAAIKEKPNDPDSYKFIKTYEPQISTYEGKPCWLEFVDFRSKNGFGGYVTGKAGVFLVVGPGGQETPQVCGFCAGGACRIVQLGSTTISRPRFTMSRSIKRHIRANLTALRDFTEL